MYGSPCLCRSKLPRQKTRNHPRLYPPWSTPHTIHHQALWIFLSKPVSSPHSLPLNWSIASSFLTQITAILPTLSPRYISNQLSSPHFQCRISSLPRATEPAAQQVFLLPVLLCAGARMKPTHPLGLRINAPFLRSSSLGHLLNKAPPPSYVHLASWSSINNT